MKKLVFLIYVGFVGWLAYATFKGWPKIEARTQAHILEVRIKTGGK